MKMIIVFLSVTVIACIELAASVHLRVTGKLVCNGKPYADAVVKLRDQDDWGVDDRMAESKTLPDGSFLLEGDATDPGLFGSNKIDPILKIYHRCNYETAVCSRYRKLDIKNMCLNVHKPENGCPLGTITLDYDADDESDCVHTDGIKD